jgi:hypothetical protein
MWFCLRFSTPQALCASSLKGRLFCGAREIGATNSANELLS